MAGPITGAEARLDAIRLARSERVGPITFRSLLARFASPAKALAALPAMARRGGRAKPLRVTTREEARAELAHAEKIGAHLLLLGDAGYPRLLAAIEDPPPVLTVQGHANLLTRPAIAIVGARNASLNGRRFAEQLARDLGQAGFVVVSGMARGIDTAAHTGALPTGTIAAMAGGIDVIYPPENADLHARIVEAGAAVSEQPPGMETRSQLFPRRNRIISGLSRGVIIVEAAKRSGSLLTARIAGDQGRDVFAVPGSPADPRAAGANALLKDGAVLVRDAQDVLAEISPQDEPELREPSGPFDVPPAGGPGLPEAASQEAREAVLERLTVAPTAVDELLRDCQLPAPDVLMAILELELAGEISRHPGNRISLA